MSLTTSTILAAVLVLAVPAYSAPWKSGWNQQAAGWSQPSPVQHYYYLYGNSGAGLQPVASDSSNSGESNTQTIRYAYSSPAVAYGPPAVVQAPVHVAAPAPVVPATVQVAYSAPVAHKYYYASSSQQVQGSGSRYGAYYTGAKASAEDHLDAHRRAIAEHQKAHAEALRRLEEAKRTVKSGSQGSDDSSEEKIPIRAYGTPQVVSFQTGYSTGYTGPKVTKEETERLHASAIAKQQELIAYQARINAAGPARADPNYKETSDDSSDSGEKTRYYYAPVPQPQVNIVGPVQKTVYYTAPAVKEVTHQYYEQKPYNGPQVSSAETAYLHRDAIAEQRKLIALQDAINAQGPAPADPNYREPSGSDSSDDGSDSSDDGSNSGEKVRYTTYVHVPAVQQEITHQYYEQKPYDGPKVTSAETAYLHRDAIAKQQEMIRQQAAIIAGVARGDDSNSGESDETKGADDAQFRSDQAREQAELARQRAETEQQTWAAKQQGAAAEAAGAIEGAYRDDDSSEEKIKSQQVYVHQTGYAQSGSSSDSGEQAKTYAFVPVYEAPIQVGYSYRPVAHTATYYQPKQQVTYKYTGPQVTREETEALHADAIAKQRAIIAGHKAFLASQRTALQTSYHRQSQDSSESGESQKGAGYYASGYYAPTPVQATINVVGPAVTNYVSGYSPATFYAAPKPAVTYVQKSVYAGSSDDSGEAGSQRELAQQEEEVRRQNQIAKEQGAYAAAEGSYYSRASYGSSSETGAVVIPQVAPTVVKSPVQHVYYRYARPTFGYYSPAPAQVTVAQKHHVVATQAHTQYQPAPVVYIQPAAAASVQVVQSDDSQEAW